MFLPALSPSHLVSFPGRSHQFELSVYPLSDCFPLVLVWWCLCLYVELHTGSIMSFWCVGPLKVNQP